MCPVENCCSVFKIILSTWVRGPCAYSFKPWTTENVTRQKRYLLILAPAKHIWIISAEYIWRVHPFKHPPRLLHGQTKPTVQDPFPLLWSLGKICMETRAVLPCMGCAQHSPLHEGNISWGLFSPPIVTNIYAIHMVSKPTNHCRSYLLPWRRQGVITTEFLETR